MQRTLTPSQHAQPEARQHAQDCAQRAMSAFLRANPHLHLLDGCAGRWEPLSPWDEPEQESEPIAYAYRLLGIALDQP